MRLKGRGCCAQGEREEGEEEEEREKKKEKEEERRMKMKMGGCRTLPPPLLRSPFVHQLRFSALQKAKIAFMTLTLFPIRLFFAAFMMLLAWPFAFIASIGSAEKQLEKPLSWWRKVVDVLLKAIMRTMWLAGGFHWINVKGRQALPTEAAILTLAPHSSYFDAIPVTMTMASIVMKAESKDIPVWGTLIKYIRPVFVSRSDQDSRRKTVEEIRRRAQSNGKWPQIMIFPEGTCTNRSCLITFKPGAFIPGVPVQPVILRYPNKLLKPRKLEKELQAYSESARKNERPKVNLNEFAEYFGSPSFIYIKKYVCTFDEKEDGLIDYEIMLKPEKLEKELQAYSESAKRTKGQRVSLNEFAEYLEVPVSDTLKNMFALFDEKEDGLIDLREYVTALSVVCRPSKTLQTIQMAFKMYQSKCGTITEEDITCILKTAMGVSDLNVSSLFRAIDVDGRGEITYDEFHRFAEMYPDFAEEYLYPDHMKTESSLETPAPNGFCTDFSPGTAEDRRNRLQKKLD
ncbi:lysophosphatidylcholine acyltransferase 1 [Sceloporus undulatus]|uniref:lysophosphatidylcholine acyltransferase 1 n=1 Tax=Sceloporus undulatus TaxID=8520 RepID=UPI001C4ABA06|nr:lysophosphatidylcholine acyltransferase 1 [Sceloporus undulatus]